VSRLARRFAAQRGRLAIHNDFEEFTGALNSLIHHELLEAKLEGLRVAPADRELEKRRIVMELARPEEFGEPGAPKELC
jgi:hypothetical protein